MPIILSSGLEKRHRFIVSPLFVVYKGSPESSPALWQKDIGHSRKEKPIRLQWMGQRSIIPVTWVTQPSWSVPRAWEKQ